MAPAPPGSLILVTGANGYIASMTIQLLLARGYRVRGTVRDLNKHSWILSHFGPNLSLVQVSDVSIQDEASQGALEEAIKGVDGIAHIASSIHFDPDPNAVIPSAIKGAVAILEAARKEKSVKSIVYTSSLWACKHKDFHIPYHLSPSTWNKDAEAAWDMPHAASPFERMTTNYSLGKMEAERACSKWMEENEPHFSFNTVLPGCVLGTMLRPDITGFISSSAHLKKIWDGNRSIPALFSPCPFIDIEDAAYLHIAALTQKDVQNERILAFAEPFSWNWILQIFKEVVPEKTFLAHVDEQEDRGVVDNARSEELLRRVKGDGWTGFEDSVRKWIPWMLEAEERGVHGPDGEVDQLAGTFHDSVKSAGAYVVSSRWD